MNTANEHRELLFRKAQCKIYQKDYIEKIHSIYRVDASQITFLSLEISDMVYTSVNKYNSNILQDDKNQKYESIDLIRLLGNSIEWLGFNHYIFIDDDWRYCGAFVALINYSINKNFRFLDKIMNDIVLISNDEKRLFSVDYWE
ncbi:MAG: hypothetical protein LBL79_13010, partial [Prevotella sp.]|nr:hypothetical protein [Prevotella sp.]